ncbi:MAG TPA: hypothetical protein DIV44_07955 [Leeuwenhoekiella sp.]|uniref:hypothetical protein n=1 Tax=Leeuwenhoekiella palythoae TaxID=573501 RepID=UPI000C4E10F2|nr:hypothetical protein [Leeuwenhoekiella palythoae]MAS21161.1 hypothetical protein [Leeuwenhoekiella sp.]MBH13234.1 hypothetical protein [Leeuwenhoekiella sp.]UBZ08936.1 hypothetical protein LDL79_08900 [Leeuwenhoekiella palythoae]HAX14628.1 hypothetical protein [Leeuwenhoekiella sp.]HCQ76723.1 hypothetical protein [Leeuwenhoekiella sp.]|tara:strand:+ start:1959 stop:3323 length:1365 start_codon:yes stop_codon:yes gene_type:complete
MKRVYLNFKAFAVVTLAMGLMTACSTDDSADAGGEEPEEEASRWITVAAARMGDNPGDGNGGTLIYALDSEEAKDPTVSIEPFDNGFIVPSNRTARLQASEDGTTIFNISYAGDTGGNYTKYNVEGGQDFVQTGSEISIAPYVGSAPRWIKLFDGDQTGAAVYVSTENQFNDNGTPEDETDDFYERTEATMGIVTLDLVNSQILNFQEHSVPLSAEEEAQGYYISRIDMPTLNAAGDKLYIGARLSKVDPETGERDSNGETLASKSIVLDYPSLMNPVVITSGVGLGNTNGYRSINAFEYNGAVYQANQGDPQGSHILRIGSNNQYDDSYEFNLDEALGVEEAYILAWRPAANGKAVLAYRHAGSAEGVAGAQGFFALVDLEARTAQQITEIPYDPDFYLFQYQGFAVNGDEIYVTQAPVGQNGNIYVVNTATGEVTKGAELVNVEGSHFIGAF